MTGPDPHALYKCPTCAGTGQMESSDSTDDSWWVCRVCGGTDRRVDRRQPALEITQAERDTVRTVWTERGNTVTGPDPQALRDALKRIEMGHYSGPFSFGAADVARKALAIDQRLAPGLMAEGYVAMRDATAEAHADLGRPAETAPGLVEAAREAVEWFYEQHGELRGAFARLDAALPPKETP